LATRLGPDFAKLTWASGVSNIGDGVMGAAFPLLVASLTRDPLLVAGAAFAGRLPWFLFALISGALADRMDRKRVLVVSDVIRAAGVGLLALAVWTGGAGLTAVYVVAFGLGVAETFFDTSAEAFTPRLVNGEHLASANGRLQAVEWVGGAFAGPPLGALLFAVAAALPFVVDAVSFAFAALMVALIPGPHRSARTVHGTIWADIKEGLGWLWGQRVLRALVLMAGVINLITFGIISIFVLYAQDILGVVDIGYGLLLSAIGIGGLVGALVSPRIVRAIGPGNTLRYVIGSAALLTGVFPFLSDIWAAGAVLLLYGLTSTGWNVVSVSLRQRLTPDQLRARVAGAARLLAWGTQPVGALLGGALGAAVGLRSPFWVAAVGYTAMLSLTWRITSNRTIRAAEAAGPTAVA
jgi:MFS family permease